LLQLEARARAASDETPPRRATSVIMLWLRGGPASIDMWDLKPAAPDGIRGEFRPIRTSAHGMYVSEHPPLMARIMHQCTLIRSLAHTIPDHGAATAFMLTGNLPNPGVQYPTLGSLATRLLPARPDVPPFVSFGDMRDTPVNLAGYLGIACNPFIV